MLARAVATVEAAHPAVEVQVLLEGAVLAGAAALDVDRRDGSVVEDLPAAFPEPRAPVEVLHVQPVALVEQADLEHRRSPDEHERAVDGVDLADVALVEARRAVLAEDRGARRPADAGEMRERRRRRRERALRGVVERPVEALEPAADHADVRPHLDELEQVVEHAGAQFGVGVEDEHEVGRDVAQRDVVGRREARVLRERPQPHRGELARHHVRGRIGARVVDDVHDQLAVARRSLSQRGETAPQEVGRAVGHDDDLEAGRRGHRARAWR